MVRLVFQRVARASQLKRIASTLSGQKIQKRPFRDMIVFLDRIVTYTKVREPLYCNHFCFKSEVSFFFIHHNHVSQRMVSTNIVNHTVSLQSVKPSTKRASVCLIIVLLAHFLAYDLFTVWDLLITLPIPPTIYLNSLPKGPVLQSSPDIESAIK